MPRFKKGDRVEYMYEGERKFGIVEKGGIKKLRVVNDGGETTAEGPCGFFNRSSQPMPADEPSVMDKWGVVEFKFYHDRAETVCFHTTITKNSVPVLEASNDGNGGCNDYHPVKVEKFRDELEAFFSDAKEWAKQFGSPGMIEPEDMWIHWKAHRAKYGMTAKTLFQEHRKRMAGCRAEMQSMGS